jgi:hypothetical protein
VALRVEAEGPTSLGGDELTMLDRDDWEGPGESRATGEFEEFEEPEAPEELEQSFLGELLVPSSSGVNASSGPDLVFFIGCPISTS